MNGDLVLIVLVGVAMVVGVAGTLLPILPGLWLIWAAGLAFGILGGFGTVGWAAMGVLSVLAIAGTAAAFVVPGRRTSAIGVSWWGQAVAAVASVVGFFLIPIVGAVLGFILGIVVASLLRTRSLKAALADSWSTLKSMLLASGIQFGTGLVMLAVWIAWVIAR
ncbi:MAG: DUF456 domain-containing protein [Actinomycetia bacterium]|nr:DUF456 domain-containing protein [Actinomycetes bacterium]